MDNERENIINGLLGRIIKKSPSEIISSNVECRQKVIDDTIKLIVDQPEYLILKADCSTCISFREIFNQIAFYVHNALIEDRRYQCSENFDDLEFDYCDFSDTEDDCLFSQDFANYLSNVSKELGIKIVLVLEGFDNVASSFFEEKDFAAIRSYTGHLVFVLSSAISIKTLEESIKHKQFYSTNQFKTYILT